MGPRRRRPLTDNGEQIRLRGLQPISLLFLSFFFLFQRFSLVRHHAPTAGQIEIRSSKHVIGYLSGVTPALVGPLPTFVSTVQHRGGSSPQGRTLTGIMFARFATKAGVRIHLPFIFLGVVAIRTQPTHERLVSCFRSVRGDQSSPSNDVTVMGISVWLQSRIKVAHRLFVEVDDAAEQSNVIYFDDDMLIGLRNTISLQEFQAAHVSSRRWIPTTMAPLD
jgi:hypothetical protein